MFPTKEAQSLYLNSLWRGLIGLFGALLIASGSARADCPPEWLPGQGVPGVDGYVNALTT